MTGLDTGTKVSGNNVLRRRMGLVLLVLVLAGCGVAEGTPTEPPALPTAALPMIATIPPTAAPTQPRATPTLVPLVTRTRAPTLTPVPTRVPGWVRCITHQPRGTEGPIWDIEVAPDGTVWVVAFRGVARLHPARKEWTAVNVEGDPEVDQFLNVTAGPGGTVWLPTRFGDGAYHWDGTAWSLFTTEEGLLSDWVTAASPPSKNFRSTSSFSRSELVIARASGARTPLP